MRICRYESKGNTSLGFYFDDGVVPLDALAERASISIDLNNAIDTLALAPHGTLSMHLPALTEAANDEALRGSLLLAHESITLRAPIAAPPKILLLAGNYAAHIEEEGMIALERAETFPYVFMKPQTTLNDPNGDIVIPRVSPEHIDYECELGIVMGKRARHVPEAEALDYVAGYTVLNDISDRQYKPFPDRKPRDRDAFFDWQHGKWHDGFCPIGPCLTTADAVPDPQCLGVQLSVNGESRQDGSTAQMIYPVAAIIEFISRSMTLLPGDIIATGTPAGVGAASGTFLQPGDSIEASIEGIGTLRNTMVAE